MSDELAKVEGHIGLYRDEKTQAIINKDSASYNSYIERRQALRNKRDEFENLQNEVSELKHLITQLIEKIDG